MAESKRFKPGYNIALGKVIHTKDDYLKELKARNLEPYDPNFKQPEPKMYKPSKQAHEITEYIKRNTDKHGKVHLSGKVMNEIGAYLPGRSQQGRVLTDINTKSGGFQDGNQDFSKIRR